jgi:hypothetical protein
MPSRSDARGRDRSRANLIRAVAGALEPPDLHRTDLLPPGAPWAAVILARVATYVAWAVSVGLVILVIGATVLAVGMVARRLALASAAVESPRRAQPLRDLLDHTRGVA